MCFNLCDQLAHNFQVNYLCVSKLCALVVSLFCFQVIVELEILYSLPDESSASFAGSQAYNILDDDQQMLIDIEQNIANLERSLSTGNGPKKELLFRLFSVFFDRHH